MPHANVTVGMPPAMLVEVEEQADELDMSRAEYIRHLVRQAHDSPFETPDSVLTRDGHESVDESETGAA